MREACLWLGFRDLMPGPNHIPPVLYRGNKNRLVSGL